MLPGLDGIGGQPPRTVEAEIESTIPESIICWARPGALHLDSGSPDWADSWQASALVRATCTGVNRGGRPERRASASPSAPSRANRARHLRAVSVHTPVSSPIAALVCPSAASNTIRALETKLCAVVGARTNRRSSALIRSVNSIGHALAIDTKISCR